MSLYRDERLTVNQINAQNRDIILSTLSVASRQSQQQQQSFSQFFPVF